MYKLFYKLNYGHLDNIIYINIKENKQRFSLFQIYKTHSEMSLDKL